MNGQVLLVLTNLPDRASAERLAEVLGVPVIPLQATTGIFRIIARPRLQPGAWPGADIRRPI